MSKNIHTHCRRDSPAKIKAKKKQPLLSFMSCCSFMSRFRSILPSKMASMSAMTVLVTGGTGLYGRAIEAVVKADPATAGETWYFAGSKDGDLRCGASPAVISICVYVYTYVCVCVSVCLYVLNLSTNLASASLLASVSGFI